MREYVAVAVAPALVATAAGADTGEDRKDLQVFNDISKALTRYTQFTDLRQRRREREGWSRDADRPGHDAVQGGRDREARRRRSTACGKCVNEITVLPVSQFDDRLRYRIARAIYGNPNFWNYAIMAESADAHRRRTQPRDADRRRAQRRRTDAGAIDCRQPVRRRCQS